MLRYLKEVFATYQETLALARAPLPKNTRKYRKLDCEVFEFAYTVLEVETSGSRVDTARGVYVPSGGSKRVWEGSWIS